MAIWINSEMSSLYFSEEPSSEGHPCIVEITKDKICVKYDDFDGVAVEYQGENKGNGHFVLTAPTINGRATLHMFPEENANILEGYWVEGGVRGMWRIICKN